MYGGQGFKNSNSYVSSQVQGVQAPILSLPDGGNALPDVLLLQEALLEDRKKLEQQLAEEIAVEDRITMAGNGGTSEAAADKAADPLDAFMSDVAVQLEHSKVTSVAIYCADEAQGHAQCISHACLSLT